MEIIDLKAQFEELSRHLAERDELLQQVTDERNEIQMNLNKVLNKLHEESNLEELNFKLSKKVEECNMLEKEVISLKTVIERLINLKLKNLCLYYVFIIIIIICINFSGISMT